MLHSKVEPASVEPKVNVGVPLEGSAGVGRMMVFRAALSTRMLVCSTVVWSAAASAAVALSSYRVSPAGSDVVFHAAAVAVYALAGSLCSLYAKLTGGAAGEASLALAVRATVPLTTSP